MRGFIIGQIICKKTDRVEILQYDHNWPRIFEAEALQIKKALGCTLTINLKF